MYGEGPPTFLMAASRDPRTIRARSVHDPCTIRARSVHDLRWPRFAGAFEMCARFFALIYVLSHINFY